MATKKKSKRAAWRAKKRPVKRRPVAKRPPTRHQPESLRLRAASPALTVGNLQRSIAFYRDVLGFTEGEAWERDGQLRGVELKAGAVILMLNQDDFAKGRDRVKGVGHRVWCSTVQDVDALATAVKARGGQLDHEPHDTPWGSREFAITDPDGFKLSFVQEA